MSTGPLSVLKTSTASTALPLIADGQIGKLRVESISMDPPTDKRPYAQIKLKLVTTSDLPNTEGHPIKAGWPLFPTFPLGTKDDPTTPQDWVMSAVAKFQDACLGTGDVGNKKGKPERPDLTEESFPEYIGKEVAAKIGVRKSEEYGDSNVIKVYQFPGDVGM